MKNVILSILFLLFLCPIFSACKKKTITCKYYYYYNRPLGMDFIGFSKADLDTIIVQRYHGSTNMTQLIGTDTIVSSDSILFAQGDTVFRKNNDSESGFFMSVKANIDYRVIILGLGQSFTITGASEGPPYSTYTTNERGCLSGRFSVYTLQNVHIDGQPVTPVSIGFDPTSRYIFLKK